MTPKAMTDLDAAVKVLDDAIAAAQGSPGESRKILVDASGKVIAHLGPDWTAARTLKDALAESGSGSNTNAATRDTGTNTAVDKPDERLLQVVRAVRDDLAFRPIIEAATPPQWPMFTPVSEIEIKQYPGYRAAFTTSKPAVFRETRNFFTLFNHIESRKIPMTAPVEMPIEFDGSGQPSQSGMAFLYPDSQTGTPGAADNGSVKIVDVPAQAVVSIGLRGRYDEKRIAAAEASLDQWLRAHPEYRRAGPARLFGWNSPGVPAARAYMEYQIPVQPVEPAGK